MLLVLSFSDFCKFAQPLMLSVSCPLSPDLLNIGWAISLWEIISVIFCLELSR